MLIKKILFGVGLWLIILIINFFTDILYLGDLVFYNLKFNIRGEKTLDTPILILENDINDNLIKEFNDKKVIYINLDSNLLDSKLILDFNIPTDLKDLPIYLSILKSIDVNYLLYFVNKYKGEKLFINFTQREEKFNTLNINNLKNYNYLKNKIVLIGDNQKKYLTPFGEMSIKGIYASILTTILYDIPIKKTNLIIDYTLILLAILTTILLIHYWGIFWSFVCIISLLVFYMVLNLYIFTHLKLIVTDWGVILGVFSYFILHNVIYLYKDSPKLKNTKINSQNIDNLSQKLKGEKRFVTILFSDITDFTKISEKLAPEDLIRLLNEYLTCMSEIIFKNKGVLDNYMGDRIMAVFGSIGEIEEGKKDEFNKINAFNCIKSALEMREKLKELQKKWLLEGIKPFENRIGINSGEVIVGYIGSPRQLNFTVIGDPVNTASRLEELNKECETTILISETTYNYVKEYVKVNNLGLKKIKGKDHPVNVYELVGWS